MTPYIKWPLRCFSLLLDNSISFGATDISIITSWPKKAKRSTNKDFIKIEDNVTKFSAQDLLKIGNATDFLINETSFKKRELKLENYGTILKIVAKRLGKSFIFLTYTP